MSLLAIELNDVGLRAVRGPDHGLLVLDEGRDASPGFATLDGKTLVTGQSAARRACLHPLSASSRFWERLDTEPADPRNPRSPNRAEVACAHLAHVIESAGRSDDDVLIAVPPVYDPGQLGILVGIARELDLPLRSIVAAPVALDLESGPTGPVVVVELALHRAVVSIVDAGARVSVGRVRLAADLGFEAFRGQWIKAIGGEFVRQTRFDPLHDAETELLLLDALPAALDALAAGDDHDLRLPAGALIHGVTVTEALLADAGHGLVFELCREIRIVAEPGPPAAILLTHDAARVPGLQRMLRQQHNAPVRALDAGAAARGLLATWPARFETPDGAHVAYHTWRHAEATAVEERRG